MNPHENLLEYNKEWQLAFDAEAQKIKSILGKDLIDIQHIGSTSIPGLVSKPIIDFAALLASREIAESYVSKLSELGYIYDSEKSSKERHLFRKDGFHLSLAYRDVGSFWERQILFRDYLRGHTEKAVEYGALKRELLKSDPTGKDSYISGKTDYINSVLDLAKDAA